MRGWDGVPHSIWELEARGCIKVYSEIGLVSGESVFFGVGFPDFVASSKNQSMLQVPMRLPK